MEKEQFLQLAYIKIAQSAELLTKAGEDDLAEEAEALSRLRAETRHRAASPLRSDIPPSATRFNIFRGW